MLKILLHTPLLGIILGPFVTVLGDKVHSLWGWLAAQKPIVKQAFAVVLAFALVALAQLIPGGVPTDCANTLANGISAACETALTSPDFWSKVVVAALTAVAVKHGQQNGSAAAQPPSINPAGTPVTGS